jgi:hypothetical protein
VTLFTEDEIVFRIDFGDDPAVGELVGLRVARQFEIHELIEIGAAGHVGFILSHARPPSPVVVNWMDWPPPPKPLHQPHFSRALRAWRIAGSSRPASIWRS